MMNSNSNVNFLLIGFCHLYDIPFFSSCNYELPNEYLFDDSDQKKADTHPFILQWECGGSESPRILPVKNSWIALITLPWQINSDCFSIAGAKQKERNLLTFYALNTVIYTLHMFFCLIFT